LSMQFENEFNIENFHHRHLNNKRASRISKLLFHHIEIQFQMRNIVRIKEWF
jgi:hypothetical protein